MQTSLHYYENKWIKKVKKNDIREVRRSTNVYRFIDDLTVFNDGGEIEQSFKEINPLELVLEKENISNSKGSFLYLFVKIENNQCCIQFYDKRDYFHFSVVRISKMQYSIEDVLLCIWI